MIASSSIAPETAWAVTASFTASGDQDLSFVKNDQVPIYFMLGNGVTLPSIEVTSGFPLDAADRQSMRLLDGETIFFARLGPNETEVTLVHADAT